MVGLTGDLRGILMFSCDEISPSDHLENAGRYRSLGPNEQNADELGEVFNMIRGRSSTQS